MKKLLPALLALTTLAAVPMVTGCYCTDQAGSFEPYDTEVGTVSLTAATAVDVPIRVSAPPVDESEGTMVEVGITDCAAADIAASVRLLRADGTAVPPHDGSTGRLSCPDESVRFLVSDADLRCGAATCSAELTVETTPEATMGGRAIEVRLLRGRTGACTFPRTDATVEILPAT